MDNNEVLQQILTVVTDLKQEQVKTNSRLDNLENEVKNLKSTLENETNHNIKLIAEAQQPLIKKVDNLVDDVEVLKFDMNVVKTVVTTHSSQLNNLPKAK